MNDNMSWATVITAILAFIGGIIAAYINKSGALQGKKIDMESAMSSKMWDELSEREKWLWIQFQSQFDQLAKKNAEMDAEIIKKDEIITKQAIEIAQLKQDQILLREELRELKRKLEDYQGDRK